MSKENKRDSASKQLKSAINLINAGPAITPPDLTREFFESLTIFAATMSGHTSVITNTGDEVEEYMFLYRP